MNSYEAASEWVPLKGGSAGAASQVLLGARARARARAVARRDGTNVNLDMRVDLP